MKKIFIKDASGTVVKTYELTHSLLDKVSLDNYKLDEITSKSGNNKTDTYRFEYYPSSDRIMANQYDYWGYVNDNLAPVSSFIPEFQIYYDQKLRTVGHSGTLRETNENKKKSGVLKKITYPTGNSTEFIYETNKVMYVNQLKACGGLRVKQIKTTDDAGQTMLRTFEYNGTNGYGTMVAMPDIAYSGYESLFLDMSGSMSYPSGLYYGYYRQRIFSSEYPEDMSFYGSQPIFYRNITEYIGDKNTNQGKIEYTYSNPYSDSYVYNIPVPYFPDTYPSYYPLGMPKSFEYDSYSKHYRYISQFGSLWKERNLSGKIEYINKNGTYKETKATTYNYTQLTATPLKGLKIFKYIQFRNDDNRHQTEEFAARDFGLPVFLFTDYYITVGKELLSSVIEKDVIDGVSVSTTKTLAYNTNNILKSTHIVNSSGESVIDEIKYPFDDGYQSQTVYLKMMSLNMLNFPVKQTIKRNGKSNSISTAYMDFGTNFIKPSQILTQKDNNPEELRIQYHRYDSYGNPVYITKDNATKVVYIWGYKGLYPVAEIKIVWSRSWWRKELIYI